MNGYRAVLWNARRWSELRPVWGKTLEGDRSDHDYWYGYAELCLYLGQEDEYLRARQALIARFGTSDSPQVAERTARACLLLPMSGEEMSKAVSLADLAAQADRKKFAAVYPYFQFVKGFAEYRRGNLDQAIAILRGDASRMAGCRCVRSCSAWLSIEPETRRKLERDSPQRCWITTGARVM